MNLCGVAPLVGAWIEIMYQIIAFFIFFVAPLVGAWIEIKIAIEAGYTDISRSSCRSVD